MPGRNVHVNGEREPRRAPVARAPRTLPNPTSGERRQRSCVLAIRLLGDVSATWMGRSVTLRSSAEQALLAALAVQERPRPRESIACNLWPEAGIRSAARLRQALWHLRQAFVEAGAGAGDVFGNDAYRLGLRTDLVCDLDVARFQSLLGARTPDIAGALALYRGDYVEDIDLECFARDREHLADLFEDALARLAVRCLRDGDLAGARSSALRLISRDPLREEAHATLIEVFGRTGSRDQVIRQYRRLVRLLEQELGVEPLAETQAAYRSAMRLSSQRSAQAIAWPAPTSAAQA